MVVAAASARVVIASIVVIDDVVAFAAFHAAADIFVRSDGGIVSGQTITVHRQ